MQTPTEFSSYLLDFVVKQMELLEKNYFPGMVMPSRLAGFPLGADVKGDLLFVLGMLHQAKISQFANTDVLAAISQILAGINGKATHSFYSYRTAETLLRCRSADDKTYDATFKTNPLLSGLSHGQIAEVAEACDSTHMIPQLGKSLPRNYVAVLGRCELARVALGLTEAETHLDSLIGGTQKLLSRNSKGFIDDSITGESRYDIYSADIYLFTEPFSDLLGDVWTSGFDNVLKFVGLMGTADGTAVPWGRSTGSLGLCINIELAGMVLGRNMSKEPELWLKRGINAAENLDSWFSDGLINAHRGKSTFAYRGPFRQVQMTLDILGKLLQTVLELENCTNPNLEASTKPSDDMDELFTLSDKSKASAWSYSNDRLRFVVPFVGGTASDYLPVPRNPSVLEYPVDSELATGVPVITLKEVSYTTGMVPNTISKNPDHLIASWQHLTEVSRKLEGARKQLNVPATLTYKVADRTIEMHAQFSLDTQVDSITWQFAETENRPLKVRFETYEKHQIASVPVGGLKPYRSFWRELTTIHQIDIPLTQHKQGDRVAVSASITPKLRIAHTIGDHHYQRSLYDPIANEAVDIFFPRRCWRNMDAARKFLKNIDQFHLHWPEHFLGTDLAAHHLMIKCIRACGVPIIWTQHNLLPHSLAQRENSAEIYQAWATAADAVIHHSESGKARVMAEFNFSNVAIHRTIFHGHFGQLQAEDGQVSREALEAELGLTPGKIRIGIIGAPRIEKNIQGFLNAFARSERPDIELFIPALNGDEQLPDDSRIRAEKYELVDRELYNQRLAVIDVLAFPIEAGDLLTTGVVGDAIGFGIPGLVSDWAFLQESLGGAAIPMGDSEQTMTIAINQITQEDINRAAKNALALKPAYDWQQLSQHFLSVLEVLGTTKN
ncbi:MAG: hypothetical protein ACJAVI_000543 [Candidatus Azotimanducaceae bacterium]|jgi:hypothetical protein